MEKFIISALLFFALSSTSVVYLLVDLPSRVAEYELAAKREREIRQEVREEYNKVRRE